MKKSTYNFTQAESIRQRVKEEKFDELWFTDSSVGHGLLIRRDTREPAFVTNGAAAVVFGFTDMAEAAEVLVPDNLFVIEYGQISREAVTGLLRAAAARVALDAMEVGLRTKPTRREGETNVLVFAGQPYDLDLLRSGLRVLGAPNGLLIVTESYPPAEGTKPAATKLAADNCGHIGQVVVEGRGTLLIAGRRA